MRWILFFLLCITWGSSFILMKIGTTVFTPVQAAGLRIFSAGLAFLPIAIAHATKIPAKKILYIVLVGLIGNLLPAFLFTTAAPKLDSSLIGLFNSLTPIWVLVLNAVFFKTTLRKWDILGVLLGFTTIVILSIIQNGLHTNGMFYALLIMAATFMYGLSVNIVSHYLKDVKPLHLAAITMSLLIIPSGIILWANGFFNIDFTVTATHKPLAALIILGVIGSAMAMAMFYSLVQKTGSLFASMVTYVVPFVAIFWGYLDGEHITVLEFICLVAILLSVYLTSMKSSTK